MYLKSFYPPLPDLPKQNVHHILFNRPDQSSWPDFTFQVDVLTGERRTFREFYARLRDGATALGTDVAHGGLGIHRENDEIVAVLSENCLVCFALPQTCRPPRFDGVVPGLCCLGPLAARDRGAVCDLVVVCDRFRVSTCDETLEGDSPLRQSVPCASGTRFWLAPRSCVYT